LARELVDDAGAKLVLPLRRADIFIFGHHIGRFLQRSEWRNAVIFREGWRAGKAKAPVDAINRDSGSCRLM